MIKNQPYTNEQLKEAIKNSFRMVEVLRKLGVKPRSGSYNLINKLVNDLKIDVSHFSKNNLFKSLNYTEEKFREAVSKSFSILEVLKKIGVTGSGGNYDVFRRIVKKYNINTSHFKGQGYLKGKHHTWGKSFPLDKILIMDYHGGITTNSLKKKLFTEKILENKCSKCGINKWNELPLSLELEHKNGNRYDNRIDNLTVLCPNCHSQTTTFRRKNLH